MPDHHDKSACMNQNKVGGLILDLFWRYMVPKINDRLKNDIKIDLKNINTLEKVSCFQLLISQQYVFTQRLETRMTHTMVYH